MAASEAGAMDIGVGDAFDDVLNRWIRIGTSVAVVGITLVAWFGSCQQQQQGYDGGPLLRPRTRKH